MEENTNVQYKINRNAKWVTLKKATEFVLLLIEFQLWSLTDFLR